MPVFDDPTTVVETPCVSTCQPWATVSDVCSPCDDYAFSSLLLADCLQAASDVLFELSGRRFAGVCQDTVRPCARSVSGDHGRPIRSGGGYSGAGYGSGYWNPSWGFCGCNTSERAGCGSLSEITLGVNPLDAIIEVVIDGETVDPSTYRIDDNRWLVRLDNADGTNDGWPCCQVMSRPTTETETWEVTFAYGQPPPPMGVRAAARLGCELALGCSPETVGQCKLPQRVTSITRQGVSMVVLDPQTFLDEGRTGLYEVDLFLTTYNRSKLARRATVMSPDIGRRVRRTGPVG